MEYFLFLKCSITYIVNISNSLLLPQLSYEIKMIVIVTGSKPIKPSDIRDPSSPLAPMGALLLGGILSQ